MEPQLLDSTKAYYLCDRGQGQVFLGLSFLVYKMKIPPLCQRYHHDWIAVIREHRKRASPCSCPLRAAIKGQGASTQRAGWVGAERRLPIPERTAIHRPQHMRLPLATSTLNGAKRVEMDQGAPELGKWRDDHKQSILKIVYPVSWLSNWGKLRFSKRREQ